MAGEADIWQPRTIIEAQANTQSVQQRFLATSGQALFNLTDFAYTVGTGALEVYKNGLRLARGIGFVEQTSTSFALTSSASIGDEILAVGFVGISGVVDIRDTDIYIANYQALRDYAGTETTVYVQGAVTSGDGGEEFFQKFTGGTLGQYVDDNDTILVPTGGDGTIGWLKASRKANKVTFGLTSQSVELGAIQQVDTFADLEDLTPVAGATVYIRSHTLPAIPEAARGFGTFEAIVGAPAATFVTDNGIIAIPAGGDGSICWRRKLNGYVSPQMYGAQLDASDQSAAIQAAIDFVRDSWDATRNARPYWVDFEGETLYTTASIDATLIRQAGFTIRNGGLYGACTGKIVLDMSGSYQSVIRDFFITSTDTSTPKAGLVHARALVSGSYPIVSHHKMFNVRIDGYFSLASYVNFASEVSQSVGLICRNRHRNSNAYTMINVNNNQTIVDYAGGVELTSDYATIASAATGAHSNILHQHSQLSLRRDADVRIDITGVTKANPAVVSCDPTDLADSALANGAAIYISNVTGMTELNGSVYIIANINTVAGTFELSGIDSTAYTTFVSGNFTNRTGPCLLLAGSKSFHTDASYFLQYGSNSIVIDLDQGDSNGVKIGASCEANPRNIVAFKSTGANVIKDLHLDMLNASQIIYEDVYRVDGGGSVRLDSPVLKITGGMSIAPSNGIFRTVGSFNIRNIDLSVPLSSAIPAGTGFIGFSGVMRAADTDFNSHYQFRLGSAGANTQSGEMRHVNGVYYGWDSANGIEREFHIRVNSATAALEDVAGAINTTAKFTGKMVRNATTGAIVWANGAAAADVWVNADGTTAHTPV